MRLGIVPKGFQGLLVNIILLVRCHPTNNIIKGLIVIIHDSHCHVLLLCISLFMFVGV